VVGSLAGVKVLSMAWMLPGPYCSLLLADLGADVVVLERPGMGDPSRLDPYFFSSVNRNKRSITVNLQSEKGKEICYKLASWADVVTEGFRPGIAKRMGIDYDSLKRINPKIIYASISGYGQDGPYRDRPAHDLTYQGVAGMLANQVSQGTFAPPPVAIADLSSAMFTTVGIIAALYAREKIGRGQYIDVSMTDGLVSWMSVNLGAYFGTGTTELLGGMEPAYGIFETKDGRHITLSIAFEDHFWRNLCNAIGKGELGDLARQERIEKRDELVEALKEAFLTKTRDEWVQILASANVPAGPVHSLEEVDSDPHLQYRRMFLEIEDTKGRKGKFVAPSLKLSETPAEVKLPSPELGEHTKEILLSLGYSKLEIEEMRKGGII
jgi:crotonobetainyl-CoA:carnitine CoA-transferase CaiB-like acyl-CoA transferase